MEDVKRNRWETEGRIPLNPRKKCDFLKPTGYKTESTQSLRAKHSKQLRKTLRTTEPLKASSTCLASLVNWDSLVLVQVRRFLKMI